MNKPILDKDDETQQSAWSAVEGHESSYSLIVQAILFLVIACALEVIWLLVRDNSVGHFIRHELTVIPATWLINLVAPDVNATALGNQILAKGGGLVVKLGCEGVEAIFIFIAAMLCAPLKKSSVMKGVFLGVLFLYLSNQLRLLVLFYTYRTDRDFFYLLHSSIAPLVLIVLAVLFFNWWLSRNHATTQTG